MANYTLANSGSTQVVSLNPEWDIKFDDRKVETVNRCRAGGQFRYVWGSYQRAMFSVEFVSSSDMCTINSWWASNSPVTLFDANSTVIHSGYLANASAPIDSYCAPYTDQFKGVIELETF